MASESVGELIRVDEVDGIPVIRFKHRTILDPLAVEAVGQRLVELVQQQGFRKLVLDFGQVESLTSAMFSKFMILHQVTQASGGKVVFCRVDPFLRQIFEVCRLPDSIPIYPDERQAIDTLRAPAS